MIDRALKTLKTSLGSLELYDSFQKRTAMVPYCRSFEVDFGNKY